MGIPTGSSLRTSGLMATPASEMTPADRLEYEREVRAATRRGMELGEPGFAYEMRAVELEGSYPETKIVIR
jgi:hypothetical protein